MLKNRISTGRLDILGSVISIACAVHCLALPVLVWLGSIYTLNMYHHGPVGMIIFVVTVVLCLWSVTSSYHKHKDPMPLLLCFTGATAIAIGIWTELLFPETFFNTSGALLIATAHLINRRLLRQNV